MRNIALDDLTEADLQQLVDDAVPEGRDLEYKRDLWADIGDGPREYIRDLGAFANAGGGDLIVGLAERDGVAADLIGLDVADPQGLQTALENRHRNRIEPRIAGIRMRWIVLANGRQTLVIRVPGSLSGPHRDRQDGHFFVRGETRKDQMGIDGLRDAFIGADQLIERLRRLHAAAVDVGSRPELPFTVSEDPAAVVSVMPLDVLRARRDLEITEGESVQAHVLGSSGANWNVILEGIVWNTVPEPTRSFAITHRQGRVDAFWTIGSDRIVHQPEAVRLSFPTDFERGLLSMVAAAQVRLRQYGVDGPWIVMTSLIGIAGVRLPASQSTMAASPPTRRRDAHLPDVLGERINDVILLPVFKAFHRVFGRVRPAA